MKHLVDNYRWRVRLANGSEYTAASSGWGVALEEAASQPNVAAIIFESPTLPTIVVPTRPGVRIIRRPMVVHPPAMCEYQPVTDASGYVRRLSFGFIEHGIAVEAQVDIAGRVFLSRYEAT